MIGFATQDLVDLRRWIFSAAVVLSVHGGIAAAIGWAPPVATEQTFPFDFINIGELAAPAEVATELPPGPEQVMSEAAISKPEQSPEEKPQEKAETKPVEEVPQAPPAADPEIPLEQVKEAKEESTRARAALQPAPATTAPVAIPDHVASIARSQVPTWKAQISGLLERNKRYPPSAQARREQGVVQLTFSIDRNGQLLASRVLASSGSSALDEEALALVRRAQPFPPPPAALPGEQVSLTVPIRFNLR
jgi:protein TonB